MLRCFAGQAAVRAAHPCTSGQPAEQQHNRPLLPPPAHLQAGAALQQAGHHGVPLPLLELLVQVEVGVAVVQRHHQAAAVGGGVGGGGGGGRGRADGDKREV